MLYQWNLILINHSLILACISFCFSYSILTLFDFWIRFSLLHLAKCCNSMNLFTWLLYTRSFRSNLIVWCVLHSRIFFHCSFFFNIWCNAQKSRPAHGEHALRRPSKMQNYYLSQILLEFANAFLYDITSGGYCNLMKFFSC